MSELVKMVSSLLTSPTVSRKDSCTDQTAMPLQALSLLLLHLTVLYYNFRYPFYLANLILISGEKGVFRSTDQCAQVVQPSPSAKRIV